MLWVSRVFLGWLVLGLVIGEVWFFGSFFERRFVLNFSEYFWGGGGSVWWL